MADVVSKTNPQAGVLSSVNTPDYPPEDWFINPVLPPGPSKYWKNDNGTLAEMTQPEKDVVDAAEAAALDAQQRLTYDPVVESDVSQTTNASFQTKLTFTTQNLPLGKYTLTASWKVWVPRAATGYEVCVKGDAMELVRQNNNTRGDTLGSFVRTFPSLSGVHVYTILWRRVSGLGEVRISDSAISIRKVT